METGRHRGAAALLALAGLTHPSLPSSRSQFAGAGLSAEVRDRLARCRRPTGRSARRSGCSCSSKPVVAQRHGLGQGAPVRRRTLDRSGSFGDQTPGQRSACRCSSCSPHAPCSAVSAGCASAWRRRWWPVFAALFLLLLEVTLERAPAAVLLPLDQPWLRRGCRDRPPARPATGRSVQGARLRRRIRPAVLASLVVFIACPALRSPPGGSVDDCATTVAGCCSRPPSVISGCSGLRTISPGERTGALPVPPMVATMDEVGQEFGCGRALWSTRANASARTARRWLRCC